MKCKNEGWQALGFSGFAGIDVGHIVKQDYEAERQVILYNVASQWSQSH